MKAVCIVFACFLLLPQVAAAANFAKQSIFLSTPAPVEGDTVVVHAIVANDSNTKFKGTLKLHEGDASIGSVAVSLDAQGAYVASMSWKPTAGSHTVTGTLEENDGTVLAQESQTFSIAAKKTTSESASSTAVGSSKPIQEKIGGISPGVAKAAVPVFGAIDSLRQTAAVALDSGSNWANEKSQGSGKKGEVLGAATQTGASVLSKALGVLSSLVKNAALFYPVLAVGFIYGLWRLYARMRRPSY